MNNSMRQATAWLPVAMAFVLASAPAHAEIKGDAIRVGVLTDMSGVFATAMGPGSVTAAKMAAEEFGGTIGGKPIQILQADHQNKPDVASALARQWFDRDSVQAIADGGTSAAALAVQDLVRANNRIFLISGPGAADLSDAACAPTSVQWTQDSDSIAAGVVSGVWQRTKEPWFFVTADYAYGHAVEASARARLAKLGGKVAGSAKAALNTSDFSAYLLAAQASGAKVLALNVAGGNATAMKQAAEFGLAAQGMTVVPMSFQNVDIYATGLPVAEGDLVLRGCVTGGAEMVGRLLRPPAHHAVANSGRGVFGRAALSPSGEGHWFRRRSDRDGADAGDTDQRCLRPERHDPA
jgi:branched-chain amino acid transport system substrate-binding protein